MKDTQTANSHSGEKLSKKDVRWMFRRERTQRTYDAQTRLSWLYSRTAELGPWCFIADLTLGIDVYSKLQAEQKKKATAQSLVRKTTFCI